MPTKELRSRNSRVTSMSIIPTPTLSYVLLPLLNVWEEVRTCGLLTKAYGGYHLFLSKPCWKRRGSRKPEDKVPFSNTCPVHSAPGKTPDEA